MKKILLVDDDLEIRTLLKDYLECNQYQVISCVDGAHFLKEFERYQDQLSLVILDIMLPDSDGFLLCQQVRKANKEVPIFMLTANAEETDRVVGLELGADDYIAKPFSPRELLARIKAIHRRFDIADSKDKRYVRFDHFVLDNVLRVIIDQRSQESLKITGIDFQLMQYLTQHAGELVSRAILTEATRGREVGSDDRFLDVQISRLRSKLSDDGQLIKTVRGQGYVFNCQVSESDTL